MGKKNPSHC